MLFALVSTLLCQAACEKSKGRESAEPGELDNAAPRDEASTPAARTVDAGYVRERWGTEIDSCYAALADPQPGVAALSLYLGDGDVVEGVDRESDPSLEDVIPCLESVLVGDRVEIGSGEFLSMELHFAPGAPTDVTRARRFDPPR